MKLALILYACLLGCASAFPNRGNPFSNWRPAGPARAPCPMLNSLANHGFLPHDGKDLTEDDITYALNHYLNVNISLAQTLFKAALTTSLTPNATTFDLDDLDRHNILEHDASLSRQDFYFGDDHTFNQTIFDQTRSFFTESIIDIPTAAAARAFRVTDSNTTNPTFNLTATGLKFGYGETAAYIIVLGDHVSGTVNTSWVEYLFENERLPVVLGWSKRAQEITSDILVDVMHRVMNATAMPTDAGTLKECGVVGFHGV